MNYDGGGCLFLLIRTVLIINNTNDAITPLINTVLGGFFIVTLVTLYI